jgi:hypothetical protein
VVTGILHEQGFFHHFPGVLHSLSRSLRLVNGICWRETSNNGDLFELLEVRVCSGSLLHIIQRAAKVGLDVAGKASELTIKNP